MLALPVIAQVGNCDVATAIPAIENQFLLTPQPVTIEVFQLHDCAECVSWGTDSAPSGSQFSENVRVTSVSPIVSDRTLVSAERAS